MSITRITPLTNDSGNNTDGTVVNANFITTMYDQIDVLVSNWTAITFAAGNFTGNGAMTVTVASGDVKRNRYQLINKTLHWQFTGRTITVGGTPNTQFLFLIPTGTFSDAESRSFNVQVSDNGTLRDAQAQVVDGTHLGVLRQDGSNWTASTDLTNIAFDVMFELT